MFIGIVLAAHELFQVSLASQKVVQARFFSTSIPVRMQLLRCFHVPGEDAVDVSVL